MDASIVAPNNSKVLTIKLRRETSRVSYSTDNRSIYNLAMSHTFLYEWIEL